MRQDFFNLLEEMGKGGGERGSTRQGRPEVEVRTESGHRQRLPRGVHIPNIHFAFTNCLPCIMEAYSNMTSLLGIQGVA
jgi:hypothetical protein